MDLHEIFCLTENTWVSKYSNTLLTQCPNNSEHEVNIDSACIKQVTQGLVYTTSKTVKVRTLDYLLTYTFEVRPISYFKILSLGSFWLRVSNYTKGTILSEQIINTKSTTIACECFDEHDLIEIDTKINNNERAVIESLSFYL